MDYANYIMMHKKYDIPRADWMMPLGLGGFQGDVHMDSDDRFEGNLSKLNKYYCELTGIHHVWKNKNDSVVGISHYRRYLSLLPVFKNSPSWFTAPPHENILNLIASDEQKNRAIEILDNYDLILPRACYSVSSVGEDYLLAHAREPWDIFVNKMNEFYGEKEHSLKFERKNYLCNMLIAKKTVFDHWCYELFDIIDGVFQEIGVSDAVSDVRYQPYRYPGYLAERFMTAFVNVHKLKVFEADVITLE